MIQTKWRGKIVALDPRQPGRQRVGGRLLFNIPELGEKFLTRLFTEMDVTLSRDERQAMDWLAMGKFALCLFCGNIEAARSQGLSVEEFDVFRWKETPAISSGSNGSIALMNQAPHANAAKLFINWLLSREGQISFQKIMNSDNLLVESLRIDIPKDAVPAPQRRVGRVKYIVMIRRSGAIKSRSTTIQRVIKNNDDEIPNALLAFGCFPRCIEMTFAAQALGTDGAYRQSAEQEGEINYYCVGEIVFLNESKRDFRASSQSQPGRGNDC